MEVVGEHGDEVQVGKRLPLSLTVHGELLQMCAVDVCNLGLCDGGTVNTRISGGESRRMSEKH